MEKYHYIPISKKSMAVISVDNFEIKLVDIDDKVKNLESTDMFDYSLLKYKNDKRSLVECYNTIIAIDKQLKLYWIANYNAKHNMLDINLVKHTHIQDYLRRRNIHKKYTCNKNLESLIDIRKLFNNPYDISNYTRIKSIGFKKGAYNLLTIDEYLSQIKSSEGNNLQVDEQSKNPDYTQESNESTTKNKTVEQSNEASIDTKNASTISKNDVLHSENSSNTTTKENQKINMSDELREKENTLRKLEEALKLREKNIGAKELQLNQRESNLGTLGVQLAKKEKSLEEREDSLKEKEKNLKIHNDTMDVSRQLKIKKRSSQLDKEEAEIAKREEELAKKKEELAQRLKEIEDENAKIQRIQDKAIFERGLIKRERAIAIKEEEIKDKLSKLDAYSTSEMLLDVKNIFTFEESEIKPRNRETVFPNYTYELLLKSLSRGDIITLPKSYMQTLSCIALNYLETIHKKGYVELVKLKFNEHITESLICILEYIDNDDCVRVYVIREYDKNELTRDDIIIYSKLYADMKREVIQLKSISTTSNLEGASSE